MVDHILIATVALLALALLLRLARHMKDQMKFMSALYDHILSMHLTESAIGTLIADLENGGTLDKCTQKEAMTTLQNAVTDLLLGNGFDLSRWNPRILINSVLGRTPLNKRLRVALEKCKAAKEASAHDKPLLPRR